MRDEKLVVREESKPFVVNRMKPRRGEIMVGCRDAIYCVFVRESPAHKIQPHGGEIMVEKRTPVKSTPLFGAPAMKMKR